MTLKFLLLAFSTGAGGMFAGSFFTSEFSFFKSYFGYDFISFTDSFFTSYSYFTDYLKG